VLLEPVFGSSSVCVFVVAAGGFGAAGAVTGMVMAATTEVGTAAEVGGAVVAGAVVGGAVVGAVVAGAVVGGVVGGSVGGVVGGSVGGVVGGSVGGVVGGSVGGVVGGSQLSGTVTVAEALPVAPSGQLAEISSVWVEPGAASVVPESAPLGPMTVLRPETGRLMDVIVMAWSASLLVTVHAICSPSHDGVPTTVGKWA